MVLNERTAIATIVAEAFRRKGMQLLKRLPEEGAFVVAALRTVTCDAQHTRPFMCTSIEFTCPLAAWYARSQRSTKSMLSKLRILGEYKI